MKKDMTSGAAGKKDNAESADSKKLQVIAPAKAMNIVVTLSDNAIAHATEIGHKLKKSGMTIETQLEGLGQYIGTSPITNLAELSNIPGVAAVEELGEVHLPPSPLDPQ